MDTGDIRIDYDALPEGTTEEDVLHELNHALSLALEKSPDFKDGEPLLKALLKQIPSPYVEQTPRDKFRETLLQVRATDLVYLDKVQERRAGGINDWQPGWEVDKGPRTRCMMLKLVTVQQTHDIKDPSTKIQVCTLTPLGKEILKKIR